ncbi:MAG: response regulator [Pseudomonadales bacterium]|nr:response regulator [Pseudomonadales bacterium]
MTKPHILCVEDQLVMQRMIKIALASDFDVDTADHGLDGFQKAVKRKDNYDLIITDLNMPEMDGITMIKRLRALTRFSGVPILVVSTESETSKKTSAKEAGANGWIVKPIAAEKLLKAAKKLTH